MHWVLLAVVTVWVGVAWGWFAGIALGLVLLQFVVIYHLGRNAPRSGGDPYRYARAPDVGDA